jgi:hypothetical protein
MFNMQSGLVLALVALALLGRQWAWLFVQRRCPACRRWLWVTNCQRGWARAGDAGAYREGLICFYRCQRCDRDCCSLAAG